MRIDRLNNIQSIWQREKQRKRRRMAYFILIVAGLAYLAVMASLFVSKRSGQDMAKFENEVVRVPGSKAVSTTSFSTGPSSAIPTYRPAGRIVHNYSQPAPSSYTPQHTWQSTSGGSSVKVYTTSSATVKNIAGGATSSGGYSAGRSVTAPSSAFGTSTSIMVLPTIARVSSHNLTASNTLEAEAEIINSETPQRQGKAGIRREDDYPRPPFLDPIGDGLWALLALVTAYTLWTIYRRKSHSIINNQ